MNESGPESPRTHPERFPNMMVPPRRKLLHRTHSIVPIFWRLVFVTVPSLLDVPKDSEIVVPDLKPPPVAGIIDITDPLATRIRDYPG